MLSLCRFLRKNIFRVGRLGMPAACALGIVRGKIIFILDSEKSADFSESLFPLRPSREKANRENPQIFPIGKYK